MALKFYTSERIGNSENRHAGGIHDISLQDRIIHFLQSRSCQIDPYDGGIIPHNELEDFSTNIERAIELISKEDKNWEFTSTELESYYKRGIAYGLKLLPPRDQVCADLEEILVVASKGKQNNLDLVFEGD